MFDGNEQRLPVVIRSVRREDAEAWERMRSDMWPDGRQDHGPEIAAFFAGTLEAPEAVLVAENAAGQLVGVAELSIHTDLPSRVGQRVGYVEGLYVVPYARRRGVARSLLIASREWGREHGCTEIASDRAGRMVFDRSYERRA